MTRKKYVSTGTRRVRWWGLAERAHREDGFTLIELTVVVMILGIILGMATLSYANVSRSINLSGAKKQVEAALNRAKNAARQENVTYELVFYTNANANANTYEFMHNVENPPDVWAMTAVDKSVSGEEVVFSDPHTYIELSNSVELTGCTEIAGDAIVVSFSPSGTEMTIEGSDDVGAVTSATVTLNLQSGSETGSVSIDGEGKITVD